MRGEDRFRIVDYKTGDAGKDPDAEAPGRGADGGGRPWTDLQLPLYRRLLEAQGVPRTDSKSATCCCPPT